LIKTEKMSIFPNQANYKTCNGHDREQEKKNFGNFNRTSCDSTKSEDGGDQSYHQKNYRVMQHINSLEQSYLITFFKAFKSLLYRVVIYNAFWTDAAVSVISAAL
jgi:hypothetical protein